ncbi:hypothetical protein [Nonomuraea sp. NPDC050643]|uniref:hypothetical protein n=1 Tax=Nonomuraea sp. NPDC050643 TaxID=3155660 RepID=UPI0033E4B2BE
MPAFTVKGRRRQAAPRARARHPAPRTAARRQPTGPLERALSAYTLNEGVTLKTRTEALKSVA